VLRVIVRVAIREVALRANAAPPVEDVTAIGDMTIDRLRHTITVAGEVRPVKPREFALIDTLARRLSFVFTWARLVYEEIALALTCFGSWVLGFPFFATNTGA
jgi:DNA-binding response OmpR family regulator